MFLLMNELSLFKWEDRYSIGIPEIDAEHQKLFAIFKQLYDAMQQGHGQDVIDKVLASLLDYTAYHFAHEELLFRTYGYPDEALHQAEHVQLTQQAAALARKLQGGQGDVTVATMKLLFDWLNQHILGSDKRYAPFLIRNGVPSSHPPASEPRPA